MLPIIVVVVVNQQHMLTVFFCESFSLATEKSLMILETEKVAYGCQQMPALLHCGEKRTDDMHCS